MKASDTSAQEGGHVVTRLADDRGRTETDWLDSRHTFSFGEYLDREFVGFRTLRVINDDRVAAGGGFGTHGHRDMEIFSYVLEGALQHEDSMGNSRVLRPGEIQLMSAGAGVLHSEFNPSDKEATHFLQVWIQPESRGLPRRYTEWKPEPGTENAAKVLVISPDGREGSAIIRQDADVYRLRLAAGEKVTHALREGRGAWLQVIEGTVSFDGVELGPADGARTERAGTLSIEAKGAPAHALLFDLG